MQRQGTGEQRYKALKKKKYLSTSFWYCLLDFCSLYMAQIKV